MVWPTNIILLLIGYKAVTKNTGYILMWREKESHHDYSRFGSISQHTTQEADPCPSFFCPKRYGLGEGQWQKEAPEVDTESLRTGVIFATFSHSDSNPALVERTWAPPLPCSRSPATPPGPAAQGHPWPLASPAPLQQGPNLSQ